MSSDQVTSSKFNRIPVPRLRPAICIAPAGSCYPPFPEDQPAFLQGFADWHDEDPLLPTIASGYAHLTRDGLALSYTGFTSPVGPALAIVVTASGAGDLWQVDLYYADPPIGPFHFAFPPAYVDPAARFDTGRLSYVNLPGQDYRTAHIML